MYEFKEEDIQVDTYRPTTRVDFEYYNHATMTRLTHKPTGIRIVVAGSKDLSRRKEVALGKLKEKIKEYYE